ncbi:hypothetical protein IQ238_10595 [Pleurocapsales cyanobacterium LEGE 06147]|nr:hypothetical protein [Pleurocapsales cyanobacterium LEGE 06147]
MKIINILSLCHGDPFDRMLIAQSQIETLLLITSDRLFSNYDVELIWCSN